MDGAELSFRYSLEGEIDAMEFTLRPWAYTDLESVVHHGCDPEIKRNMSDAFPETREQWEAFLAAAGGPSRLYLAIDVGRNAIGSVGVSLLGDVARRNAELGYWLGKAFQGHGIVTRAVREICGRAFDLFDIDRIVAKPYGTNKASHRVLEKVGFTLEARFEKKILKNGELLDELIYAIRRPE